MPTPAAPLEFSLIDRIRQRAGGRPDVVLGIGDDAALLQPPAGRWLVAAQDTLNEGVHFPVGTDPAAIGWKSLAVNLSDLAAMGAAPAWCLLSLSLPAADPDWVERFLDGFCALAAQHDMALVGGDTTRGPLSLSIAAFGTVPAGQALRRSGACVGDEVWVTGTLGDAAAALPAVLAGAPVDPALRERLDRPTPRITAGRALRGLASACIDVSDGLLADLGHLLAASSVGADLQLDALPASAALRREHDDAARWNLQLTGGDDYELCFTAASADHGAVADALQPTGVSASVIGRIVDDRACRLLDPDGRPWQPPARGFEHFVRADRSPAR